MSIRPKIADKASFAHIRYARCWEDADVLLAAMDVRKNDTCLSIAAAGDNALALVGAGAGRVIAVDLSPAQIACLELRAAAIRTLSHTQFLALLGEQQNADWQNDSGRNDTRQTERRLSDRRVSDYRRCRKLLSRDSRQFWDSHPALIAEGIAQGGKFERYLRAFRRFVLPLVHDRRTVERLFAPGTAKERQDFYEQHWNNKRWDLLCRLFFSRMSLGHLGRDPRFMDFADEPVWTSLRRRIPQALVEQHPADNPYLQWILAGRCVSALPYAWRAENFEKIRANIDCLEWRCESIEQVLAEQPPGSLDGCNLSDIFEYMSPADYEQLLAEFVRVGAAGCRLVYWNVVANRHSPETLRHALRPNRALADRLHQQDKAFFYRDFVVEEVV